jgi:SRSO17 transposase
MTEQEITALGPAFGQYLRRFRPCFLQERTAGHFATCCRGLLTDLPRKSVEPIALAAGTVVRTLQQFFTTAQWDHHLARDLLQQHLAAFVAATPADDLGTVGIIDETSCRKWGDQTPGVQRQYLGCVGKIEHGIVTVHLGVSRGRCRTLLDAELYLSKSWAADRERCQAAGIPDELGYRPKWQIAWEQWERLTAQGWSFDWLVFDEGYGAAVPLLRRLNQVEQRFVAEVPVNFTVRTKSGDRAWRADECLTAGDARAGTRQRVAHETRADSVWRAQLRAVWVAEQEHTLVVAINEATAEVKYFLSNAVTASLPRLLTVAFRRYPVEQSFRLAKQEAGLLDFEGRDFTGLSRHLLLALVVLGFVAEQTQRLRGEKSGGDGGAGVSGVERALRGAAAPVLRRDGRGPRERGHHLPPTAQSTGRQVA